jgi:hypothetical protein
VVSGTVIPTNALFLPKETSVYSTVLFSENTTSNVLLGMKLAGGCLPCVPDHEEGRAQRQNIIVYDDIAHNPENPRPGVIINHPQGGDVYTGVPKVPTKFLEQSSH